MVKPTSRVTAYPRVHVTLVDLGHCTHRAFGGAGFTLDWPRVTVVARRTDGSITFGANGHRIADARLLRSIGSAIERLRRYARLSDGLFLDLEEGIPQHIGLGSGTATTL